MTVSYHLPQATGEETSTAESDLRSEGFLAQLAIHVIQL